MPPVMTVVALPLMLVLGLESSALLPPSALNAALALISVLVPASFRSLLAVTVRSLTLSILMPLSSSVILLPF